MQIASPGSSGRNCTPEANMTPLRFFGAVNPLVREIATTGDLSTDPVVCDDSQPYAVVPPIRTTPCGERSAGATIAARRAPEPLHV